MKTDLYWDLVEAARRTTTEPDEVAEHVRISLEKLPAKQIYAFLEAAAELDVASYNWALWGAAYLINGGCSDDGFDYFRGWLMTQGREVFERALRDPDSLADVVDDEGDVECELMITVGPEAYNTVAGNYPEGPMVHRKDLGEGWDFDDAEAMKKRYPRLWEKFGYE